MELLCVQVKKSIWKLSYKNIANIEFRPELTILLIMLIKESVFPHELEKYLALLQKNAE